MTALRLIVGLGNPGSEHLRTRHNAGFWFVDALAQREGARFGLESKLRGETAKISLAGQSLWVLKPITYMNASGASVGSVPRTMFSPWLTLILVGVDPELERSPLTASL